MELINQIKLAQYTYKLGLPLYQDTEYDMLVREYRRLHPNEEINLHWEQITDEEGLQLLYESGIGDNYILLLETMGEQIFPEEAYLKTQNASDDILVRYYKYKPTSNKSMPIVTETKEFIKVVEHLQNDIDNDVILSLKLDGWNVTLYVENGEIVYAHTRGRQAEAQDVTSIMKQILSKRNLDLSRIKQGYIVGELILRDKELIPLRAKYRKKFKTTRNSLSSFINNKVIAEDLPKADFVAFHLNFVDQKFTKKDEMLKTLDEMGFEIPYNVTCDCTVEQVLFNFINMSNKINSLPPSDGVVIQPNDLKVKEDLNQIALFPDSYEIGLYALKMANWGTQVLKTFITGIDITRNTKTIKPSLKVEPVMTRDGREITTVPVDHIGRMVDEDLYVGKEISISVVSEKDIRLMYDRDKASIRTNA